MKTCNSFKFDVTASMLPLDIGVALSPKTNYDPCCKRRSKRDYQKTAWGLHLVQEWRTVRKGFPGQAVFSLIPEEYRLASKREKHVQT